jgi:hypothetical protein
MRRGDTNFTNWHESEQRPRKPEGIWQKDGGKKIRLYLTTKTWGKTIAEYYKWPPEMLLKKQSFSG